MECAICYTKTRIPFALCERHTACYACSWSLLTISAKADIESKGRLRYNSCCPFCKKSVYLTIDEKNQTFVEGIRSIPDDILRALGSGAEPEGEHLSCYFCPFTTTGDRVGMVIHVQNCNQRTIPCPNKDCDAKIKLETGFDFHQKAECKKVRCGHCPFQGSREQAAKHEEAHMLLVQLQSRCEDFVRYLKGYSLPDEKLVDQFGIDSFTSHIEDFLRHYNSGDLIYGLFQSYRPSRPMQPPPPAHAPPGRSWQQQQQQPPVTFFGGGRRSLTIPAPPPLPPGMDDDLFD